ncbi:MAG: glycosyltransferase family protein [bacterium]
MKIFYAVQATGNGHISRATEILPYLQQHGTVDVFLSGNNFALNTNLPVAYRSKGLSLKYDKNGGVDILGTATSVNFKKIWNEARSLPIEKYDLVINDFESITSLACKLKKIPSIHFGHQASFKSKLTPRPKEKNILGEWVLRNYARGTSTIGLHFKSYDKDIYPPIIKKSILQATPSDAGHITVYLAHYADEFLIREFQKLKKFKFELFSVTAKTPYTLENVQVYPVTQILFNKSLINCHGVITGAGFETPAEALYLRKKIIVVPMKKQYEQACNTAALNAFGVMSLNTIDEYFPAYFNKWIFDTRTCGLNLTHNTEQIINSVIHKHKELNDTTEKEFDGFGMNFDLNYPILQRELNTIQGNGPLPG